METGTVILFASSHIKKTPPLSTQIRCNVPAGIVFADLPAQLFDPLIDLLLRNQYLNCLCHFLLSVNLYFYYVFCLLCDLVRLILAVPDDPDDLVSIRDQRTVSLSSDGIF